MNRQRSAEKIIWSGRTSPMAHVAQYVYGMVFAAMLGWVDLRIVLIPLAICIWYWVNASATRYELTPTRLLTYSGMLSKNTEELPISDVLALQIQQTRSMKMFSLTTVLLVVDESSQFQPCVIGVANADRLVSALRKLVPDLPDVDDLDH